MTSGARASRASGADASHASAAEARQAVVVPARRGGSRRRSGLRRLAGWLLAVPLAAGLAVLAPAAPAVAHNQLIESDPPADATLTTSPETVELVFVEPLNPEYTTVVVTEADETPVTVTGPEIDRTRAVVTFPEPLADGVYTVAFRVVSADGHPVQGSYEFTVAAGDPGAGSPPGSSPPAADGADADAADPADDPGEVAADPAGSVADSDGGGATVLLLVGAGVLLVAVVAGVGISRRRQAG